MQFLVSFLIFIFSTFFYQSYLYTIDSFFIKQVILLLLQCQMFFVLGLFFGDMYRNKKIQAKSLISFSIFLIFLGFILNYLVYDIMTLNKSPYTFGKFINLLWSAPIILILLYQLHKYLSSGFVDCFIRVVGRNSLAGFVASEIVIKIVRLFLEVNRYKLKWLIPLWLPTFSGILAVIAITTIMWLYEFYSKAYIRSARGIIASTTSS